MTLQPKIAMPKVPPLPMPENAPFSVEQKQWLGGFFAALLETPTSGASAVPETEAQSKPDLADSADAPWHDPAMPLADRMKLSEGRPIAPRLMSAMAQQDCGQCGYTCATYANALYEGHEGRQNLCAPGGKETLRALKGLMQEVSSAGALPSPRTEEKPKSPERSFETVRLATRYRLSGDGSAKDTWHIEFDLEGTNIDYVVGDSLGLLPRNAPALVDAVIGQLALRPDYIIHGKTLREALINDYDLGLAPDALFELIGHVTGGQRRQTARALAYGEDPDKDAAMLDVLATLHKFSGVRFDAEAFLETLQPLQPRLYSISSSPKYHRGRVSLTVDAVRYIHNGRLRLGVASTYLSERLAVGAEVNAYIQKAHNFALPASPDTPIIMIGPGTGIAPFRAFLQERAAIGAKGKNWLFFGHQKPETDFFYRPELEDMQAQGLLTRLSLAWSRQSDEKFYVQDRMRQSGIDLWKWIEAGAHIYVCGDAKKMARDVERTLVEIARDHGGMSGDVALSYVNALKANHRYQADVY